MKDENTGTPKISLEGRTTVQSPDAPVKSTGRIDVSRTSSKLLSTEAVDATTYHNEPSTVSASTVLQEEHTTVQSPDAPVKPTGRVGDSRTSSKLLSTEAVDAITNHNEPSTVSASTVLLEEHTAAQSTPGISPKTVDNRSSTELSETKSNDDITYHVEPSTVSVSTRAVQESTEAHSTGALRTSDQQENSIGDDKKTEFIKLSPPQDVTDSAKMKDNSTSTSTYRTKSVEEEEEEDDDDDESFTEDDTGVPPTKRSLPTETSEMNYRVSASTTKLSSSITDDGKDNITRRILTTMLKGLVTQDKSTVSESVILKDTLSTERSQNNISEINVTVKPTEIYESSTSDPEDSGNVTNTMKKTITSGPHKGGCDQKDIVVYMIISGLSALVLAACSLGLVRTIRCYFRRAKSESRQMHFWRNIGNRFSLQSAGSAVSYV